MGFSNIMSIDGNIWSTNYESANYSLLTCLTRKKKESPDRPHAHGHSLSHASNDVDETTA
jgi:hypothetical protein